MYTPVLLCKSRVDGGQNYIVMFPWWKEKQNKKTKNKQKKKQHSKSNIQKAQLLLIQSCRKHNMTYIKFICLFWPITEK